MVQFLQSDVPRTSCDGREWFPKAIEVLGTARPNDAHTRYISNEKAKARHMPRSAKTISNDVLGMGDNALRSVHKPRGRSKDLDEGREGG